MRGDKESCRCKLLSESIHERENMLQEHYNEGGYTCYRVSHYCFGRIFVKVLTQDSALLHGVIAFARTHYHAG